MSVYAPLVQEALAGSIDTGKLAEAWQALHPKDVTKAAVPVPDQSGCQLPGADRNGGAAGRDSNPGRPWAPPSGTSAPHNATKAVSPALGAFLGRAGQAISRALHGVLTRLWTEAWVLGNRSALAAVDDLADVDWGAWTPGDYAAAEQIAGPGLRQLLAEQGITIKSIADSRLEELSKVLEETLRSDEITRQPGTEPLPPFLSVGDLADRLKSVLDNPANAELVAQAEIARAQASAARQVYAETGRTEVEVSTAEDDKVCAACDAAQKLGAHPLGSPPLVPLHPRCRCAELPVLERAEPAAEPTAPAGQDDDSGYAGSLDYEQTGGDGGGSITAYERDPKAHGGRSQVGHINWGGDNKVHDLGTSHDRHRRGIASELWRRARQMTGGKIAHSAERTAAGDEFARHVGGNTPPRSDWGQS